MYRLTWPFSHIVHQITVYLNRIQINHITLLTYGREVTNPSAKLIPILPNFNKQGVLLERTYVLYIKHLHFDKEASAKKSATVLPNS